MSRSLGIPVKLLHEASGHVVTVELKSGELYRGSMVECEDNWNCQLESITYTAKVTFVFLISVVYFLFSVRLFQFFVLLLPKTLDVYALTERLHQNIVWI